MNQDIHKANFWNFGKNSNFLLFIDIEWLEMIVSNKKWSLLMILTTKKAAHIAKFAEFVWFVWLCSYVQTVHSLDVFCKEKNWKKNWMEKNYLISHRGLSVMIKLSESLNNLENWGFSFRLTTLLLIRCSVGVEMTALKWYKVSITWPCTRR